MRCIIIIKNAILKLALYTQIPIRVVLYSRVVILRVVLGLYTF